MSEDVGHKLREHMEKALLAYVAAFDADACPVGSLEAQALGEALARLGLLVEGLERLTR